MLFLLSRRWQVADPCVSPAYLDFQADRIERVLASHRYPERVVGGLVFPEVIYYGLTLGTLGSPSTVCGIRRLSEELELALGVISIEIVGREPKVVIAAPRPCIGGQYQGELYENA